MRTLFITGDRDFGDRSAAALEDEGIAVTIAPTASDGLDRLDSGTFDCVVSTYELPDRDGVGLLEAVRDNHPDLPFVLYTEGGSEEIAAEAISAGVTEYVRGEEGTDRHAAIADRIETAVDSGRGVVGSGNRPQRLEQVLKAVPGCIVQLDSDGQFVYANHRAEEVLGLERSRLTERAYNDPEWEIRDTDGAPIPDERLPFRLVMDSGEPVHDYRHSVRWPDGSHKILSVSGVPLFDEEGAVESTVFSLTEVTERTEREQVLKRYRRITKHLDDIATIIAPDGTITYVSPSVERVLGYEPDELIGENGFGFQPPEASEAIADAIEHVLANPSESRTARTKFRCADGSYAWIESTLQNYVDDEYIGGILVSSRDVTERINQKRRVQERERQLSRLHEATRELLASESPREVARTASSTAVDILDLPLNGIHFYDEDADGLRPVAVSEGSREMFGEVPVIDEGIAWEVFRTGERRICNDLDEANDVYNPETPVGSEMHLPLLERGVFIVSSTEKNGFEETDIEFARVLAANTEAALARIDREERLRTREAELEQQNERLEEFASIVSHDLRNPLNVAQSRMELLTTEFDSEHLSPAREALARMEEIVSDTLTLARQGDIVSETEPIPLTGLVHQCWGSVSSTEASIAVDDEVTIRGDRSRLRHVFENLFRNAVEHGGECVTLTVGRIDDGIYIEDDGPGIPAAEREAVFEPGHTSEPDGTGFGLSIVKRIVEAHGWEIEIVAGTDGGTRFEVTGVETVTR